MSFPHSSACPQLYHEDKGYDDRHLVFLSPLPPSLSVRRVLLTHHSSRKMTYLQGTPFRHIVSRGPRCVSGSRDSACG